MGKMRDDFEQLVIFVGAKLAKWSGLASDESAKRRYLGGMKPDKYYDEVVYPDLKETFEILGFKYDKGKEARTSRVALVFLAFIDIDDDNSGEVSVKEFHAWLKYPLTKFSERVFGMLDLDNSGFLDFNEFLIGVWNWNTYDASLIAKLAYNIFDVDREGKIDMAEADAMLRMVYNVPKSDRKSSRRWT
ncbi:Ca2-binding protein [Aureococcus anophagefferens]|nr:Ca2-binding protein [Aureococcus anophagefferens]